jgi:hypothetical protein
VDGEDAESDADGVDVDDVVRADVADSVVRAAPLWLPLVAASATPVLPAAIPAATRALAPRRSSLPLFM